jgi:hypothetical protein
MSNDPVNRPAHYTSGRYEAIEVIEDAVYPALDAVTAGCHWQALKYLLRLWFKGEPLQDARKARWYLDRLISKLEGRGGEVRSMD